jgi:hypothetical protein
MRWAVHVSIAPAWFDPGEHSGIITSMMIFYALHDALVKPMYLAPPRNTCAPTRACLGRMVDCRMRPPCPTAALVLDRRQS